MKPRWPQMAECTIKFCNQFAAAENALPVTRLIFHQLLRLTNIAKITLFSFMGKLAPMTPVPFSEVVTVKANI